MSVISTSWGGGNVHLQSLAADGSTYLDVGSSTNFTTNGCANCDLSPGSYQLSITTATGVYAEISEVPY